MMGTVAAALNLKGVVAPLGDSLLVKRKRGNSFKAEGEGWG